MISLEQFVFNGNVLIAAHRGASGDAPENTLSAFKLAFEQGANMLETDLHFTKDGFAVAFHDLGHLIKSGNYNTQEMTLEEIKQLDAGSWFDPKFANETIPTLEEILEFAKGKTYVNLEIKEFSQDFNKSNIENTIDLIKQLGMKDYTMFASFNYGILKFIKSIDKEIHTAAIKIPGKNTLPSEIATETSCEAFICDVNELTEKINLNCKENNLFLGTYSIDNEEDFKKIIKYNIKAIGTNYPSKILKYLKKYDYHGK